MPGKKRAKAKFQVGQVVATTSTEATRYFQIGHVSRIVHDDIPNHADSFWYTENKEDRPPYYTEGILRSLTNREIGPRRERGAKP